MSLSVTLPLRSRPLDEIDFGLLDLVQRNARLSNAELGRRLGVSTTTAAERLRKLEAAEVVLGYEARIDPRRLGLAVTAFVLVAPTEIAGEDAVEAALLQMPQVLEVHKIAGEESFLVKLRAADNESLGRLLREGVERVGVRSLRTIIVLATARERQTVPLAGTSEEP